MTDQDFFAGIKAGQYIKTRYRDERRVRKVSKVTRTQVVISEWGWGDTPNVDRFRISDGRRLGDIWYYPHSIISDPVSDVEIAAYEANIAEGERFRKERKRLKEIESWAKDRLASLLGLPAENIKVNFSSSDGLKTGFFEIKCEKISEAALVAALGVEKQGVTA